VRIVYPKMKELDAYHQVLYQIYHYDWPDRKLDALRKSAEQLAAKCGELQADPIPKRLAAKEAELKASFTALCAATTELVTVSKGKDVDAIGKAVEKVHTAYQKSEGACG
jgi:hypothetical protein